MAKIVRRAAKKAIINAKDSHSLLSLLIFDEKIVGHNIRKLCDSKQNASLSLLKWAKQEDNLALYEVFSKGVEVSSIWAEVFKQHCDKHMQYRSTFKEILREERELDEIRKREVQYTAKLNKLQKQVEQSKRKSDIAKSKSLSEEMAEILTLSEEAHAELEVKVTKHEIFKAQKMRAALYFKSESIETFAQQALSISKAYKELADLIPDTPTQLSNSKVYPGAGQTRRVVTELAKDLQMEPVVKADEDGKPDHTYLYAVTAVQRNAESIDSPPPSPSTVSNHQKLHTSTSAGPHLKSSHESLFTPRLSHAQSLDDLRPPPSCPPPPLPRQGRPGVPKGLRNQMFGKPQSLDDLSHQPKKDLPRAKNRQDNSWYASSKIIDEETENDDSDGYTEPFLDPNTMQYTSTETVSAYKSLSRHSNNNNDGYTRTVKEECNISRKNTKISYQALSSEKNKKDAPHYDGCYLELLHD